MMTGLVLLACTGTAPDRARRDPDTPPTPTTTTDTGPTVVQTAETGIEDTGSTTTTVPIECAELAPGPLDYTTGGSIEIEEDFDFDIDGLLISQIWTDLLGTTKQGDQSIVAVDIGEDVAGIRSLPSGDVIVANQNTGAVRMVDHATGASAPILTGIIFPNGLEVGVDGMAYVSDYHQAGSVRMFDPYDAVATVQIITELPNPNGLALSPDEQVLYIAVTDTTWGGDGRVVAIDRNDDGTWDPTPRLVYDAGTLLDALAVDVCGNLYVTEYSDGNVLRVRTDGTVEPLVDLSSSGYSSARFGHGRGGWPRDVLYVSNRADLWAIQVGVDGRHVLAVDDATDTGR